MNTESEIWVLRKDAHWFVLEAPVRVERDRMILDLLVLAESHDFTSVPHSNVQSFAESLGWELKIYSRSSNAA